MKHSEIDLVLSGLIESAGSRDLRDVLAHLGITVKRVAPSHPLLQGADAIYMKSTAFERVYISETLPDELYSFTVAHEIGHAILHGGSELDHTTHLYKVCHKEEDAHYFAVRLLNLSIDRAYYDGYTDNQIAGFYGIQEDAVRYLAIDGLF